MRRFGLEVLGLAVIVGVAALAVLSVVDAWREGMP